MFKLEHLLLCVLSLLFLPPLAGLQYLKCSFFFFIHKNVPPTHQTISLGSCGSWQHDQVSVLTWKWKESRSWAVWEALARQEIPLSRFPQTTFFWNYASRRVPTQAALLPDEVKEATIKLSWELCWASLSWKPLLITSHLAGFQRLMSGILSGLIHRRARVHVEDGIINSLGCELHLKDLQGVLRRQENEMTVNYSVCQFWEKPADFLGH